MDDKALYIISILGAGSLIGAFIKMKPGFGPYNLRVIGIILIATFSSILALAKTDSLNASIGILGAIAGYLFGIKDSE